MTKTVAMIITFMHSRSDDFLQSHYIVIRICHKHGRYWRRYQQTPCSLQALVLGLSVREDKVHSQEMQGNFHRPLRFSKWKQAYQVFPSCSVYLAKAAQELLCKIKESCYAACFPFRKLIKFQKWHGLSICASRSIFHSISGLHPALPALLVLC